MEPVYNTLLTLESDSGFGFLLSTIPSLSEHTSHTRLVGSIEQRVLTALLDELKVEALQMPVNNLTKMTAGNVRVVIRKVFKAGSINFDHLVSVLKTVLKHYQIGGHTLYAYYDTSTAPLESRDVDLQWERKKRAKEYMIYHAAENNNLALFWRVGAKWLVLSNASDLERWDTSIERIIQFRINDLMTAEIVGESESNMSPATVPASFYSIENMLAAKPLAELIIFDEWLRTLVRNTRQTHPTCLLYTSPSPRGRQKSRMPSSA